MSSLIATLTDRVSRNPEPVPVALKYLYSLASLVAVAEKVALAWAV